MKVVETDKEREEILIQQNTGLIISRAKTFKPHSPELLDEYIQIGRIGLLKAIRKHDPSRSALSTLAWKYIGWEIMRYLNKENRHTAERLNNNGHYSPELELWEILPDTLSEKERQVVEMRWQGLTFREIGFELGDFTKGWANRLFKTAAEKIREANG